MQRILIALTVLLAANYVLGDVVLPAPGPASEGNYPGNDTYSFWCKDNLIGTLSVSGTGNIESSSDVATVSALFWWFVRRTCARLVDKVKESFVGARASQSLLGEASMQVKFCNGP